VHIWFVRGNQAGRKLRLEKQRFLLVLLVHARASATFTSWCNFVVSGGLPPVLTMGIIALQSIIRGRKVRRWLRSTIRIRRAMKPWVARIRLQVRRRGSPRRAARHRCLAAGVAVAVIAP
jgi:hypothetical protein